MAEPLSDYEFALDQIRTNPDMPDEEMNGLIDFVESYQQENAIDPAIQARNDLREKNKYEQFKDFTSKLNETPTKGIERRANIQLYPGAPRVGLTVGPGLEDPSQENPDQILRHNNAASGGFDIHTGFSPKSRAFIAALDFADPYILESITEGEIRKNLPNVSKDIPVKGIEPHTGKPWFLRYDPDADQYRKTLFDPYLADTGDISELAATIAPIMVEMGGEYLGAVGGAALAGRFFPSAMGQATSAGATAGAGGARALTVPMRVGIAKVFGVPDEYLEDIKVSDAMLAEGLEATLGTGAAYGIVGSFRAWRNFRHRPLEADQMDNAKTWEEQIAETQKLVERLNRIDPELAGQVKLTMGQATGSASLSQQEALMLRTQRWGEVNRMRGEMIQTEQAMTELAAEAGNSFKHKVRGDARPPPKPDDATPVPGLRPSTDTGTRESVSGDAQAVLLQPLDDAIKNADYAADSAVVAMRMQRAEDLDDVYLNVRNAAWKRLKAKKELEKMQWDQARELGGWDVEKRASRNKLDNRGPSALKQLMAEWQTEATEAQLRTLRQAKEGALLNAGYSPSEALQMANTGDPADFLAQEFLDPHYFHMAESHINSQLRALKRAGMDDGVEGHDLRKLLGAMKSLVDDHVGAGRRTLVEVRTTQGVGPNGPTESTEVVPLSRVHTDEFVDAWRTAADTTREKHQLYDSVNMRHMLKTELQLKPEHRTPEGYKRRAELQIEMPNAEPSFIRNGLFAEGKPQFLREALFEAGYKPETILGLRRGLKIKYRDSVVINGKFQETAHQKFMEGHKGHLEALGIDADEIESVASFGRANLEAEAGLARMRASLIKDYGKFLSDPTSPIDIADDILSKKVTPAQAQNIMNRLGRHDERLKGALQDQILDRVMGKITNSKYKELNSTVLNDLLNTQGDTLTAVLGKEYVDDLHAIADVQNRIDNKWLVGASKVPTQSGYMALFRSLFGPLSKKQRFLTAAQRVARESRAGRVTEMFKDPGSLRQFVAIKHMNPNSTRFWVAYYGSGLGQFVDEMDETDNLFEDIGWTAENSQQAAELKRLKEMYDSGEMARREQELADKMRPVDAGINRLP